MTRSVELTFDQLVKAVEKLRPEETEQLAQVVERHRREVEETEAKARRRLRQEALKRMLLMEEAPVSDWEQMEREIAEARLEAYKRCSDVPL
jgi:formylmethanofuran dehydrogenase subunit E